MNKLEIFNSFEALKADRSQNHPKSKEDQNRRIEAVKYFAKVLKKSK